MHLLCFYMHLLCFYIVLFRLQNTTGFLFTLFSFSSLTSWPLRTPTTCRRSSPCHTSLICSSCTTDLRCGQKNGSRNYGAALARLCCLLVQDMWFRWHIRAGQPSSTALWRHWKGWVLTFCLPFNQFKRGDFCKMVLIYIFAWLFVFMGISRHGDEG